MKIRILITGLLGLASVTTYAQKGELNNAKDKYDNYNVGRQQKLTAVQAAKDIADAKTSIDKASTNAKTSALPQTFALKGAIYSSLAVDDTVPATSEPNFKIADENLRKAKSLDSAKQDKDNEKLIDAGFSNLAQIRFNRGRVDFQDKKYELAYNEFEYFRQTRPNDTLALYVTGLSATMAGNTNPKYYDIAKTNYNKLLTTNYSQREAIYSDLTEIYLNTKDTTNALKTLSAGIAAFPANNKLRKREIEIGLLSGKQEELIGKIQNAITSDPKNKDLYYYEGMTYSQIAESIEAKQKKTKDATAKKALEKTKLDNYAKAAEQYKKAIEIDPEYFEANLNLGYVTIKPAIDDYNAANLLPANQQKAYDAAVAKSMAEFDAAKPYLLKAVELKPKSVDALMNLKAYYLAKKDMTNANATQKKIEALGGGN